MDNELPMSQQWDFAAKKISGVPGCIRKSFACRLREVIIPFCSALMKPHMEYYIQFWASQYKTDKLLKQVQYRAMRMMRGLKHLSCKERLKELGLFTLENRRVQEVLINVYKCLEGGCPDDRTRLFSIMPRNRTRGSRHKRNHRKFHLNISKNFVTPSVTEHWNRLPREVMGSPSLRYPRPVWPQSSAMCST